MSSNLAVLEGGHWKTVTGGPLDRKLFGTIQKMWKYQELWKYTLHKTPYKLSWF